jgi:hypothetical protein
LQYQLQYSQSTDDNEPPGQSNHGSSMAIRYQQAIPSGAINNGGVMPQQDTDNYDGMIE